MASGNRESDNRTDERRLTGTRFTYTQRVTTETPEARERRLCAARLRYAQRRSAETPEAREQRLSAARLKYALRRSAETPEERTNRSEVRRETYAQVTPEGRSNRSEVRRESSLAKRQRLTSELPVANGTQILDVSEHDIGEPTLECNFCAAKHWKEELSKAKKFTNCCHDGKVSLPPLRDPPELLRKLLTDVTSEGRMFREHIREYNSALAFASMGAHIKPPPGHGPYCFRIHGQIYHMVSPLYSNSTNKPGYGQLYIFDSAEATTKRLANESNQGCTKTIMLQLDEMMRTVNPFAESYKQMHEITKSNPATQIKMIIMEDPSLDLRRYNAPTSKTEVAAIFVGDDGEPPVTRDICVYPQGESCKTISPMNMNCDPMVYPLLFPYGESGWHLELKHVEARRTPQRTSVTQLQFYSYRLSIRSQFSVLHYSGKLLQQYIVDAYVKAEGARLNYLRFHQKELRVEQYRGLMDALEARAQNSQSKIGQMIILPSTFQGSPRYMQQNYQDAMAIVRKFGKPDFFLTFTCNPNWPEIVSTMSETQRPEHRPDIVVRVFKIKLRELLDDILKKNIFGIVIGYIYVIEFQKRGLPHAHMLLTLDSNSKIRTKEDIDRYVTAELPNKEINPRLFEIVTKCMVHGPCGTINPGSQCMKEGKCSKGFPKEFVEKTQENVNGYPLYQRKEGVSAQVGKYAIDNRWIVPYNPWLSKKFNAHINVEICASVKSVKYLYKYVYKGHDAASVKLQNEEVVGAINHDEIINFLDGRYVSAPEAMWRLNEFTMAEKSHAVIRLPVHLPDMQPVVFREGEEQEALQREMTKNTMLQAWFELNQIDTQARTMNYV